MSLYNDFPIDSPRYDNTVRVYGGEMSSSRRTSENPWIKESAKAFRVVRGDVHEVLSWTSSGVKTRK